MNKTLNLIKYILTLIILIEYVIIIVLIVDKIEKQQKEIRQIQIQLKINELDFNELKELK